MRSFRHSFCKAFNRRTSSSRLLSSSNKGSGYDSAGILLFGGISLGTLGLGVWQLQRYFEKVASQENIAAAQKEEMISFPEYLNDEETPMWAKGNKSRKLQLVGTFEHSNEIHLGLRSLPSGQAQGLASNPQGYFIITPFRLKNGGWVPRQLFDYNRPSGTQIIEVIVSDFEKPRMFSPKNDPSSKTLLWLESSALLVSTSHEEIKYPLMFEVLGMESHNTYPIPKSNNLVIDSSVTPLTHLVYSATWFSLATAGFAMTYVMFKKKPKSKVRLPK